MKIMLTGATGLIGKKLGIALVKAGHEIVVVSRDSERARRDLPFPCRVLKGDLEREPLQSMELDRVDAVIHLAGENIAANRWSEKVKSRILSSRQRTSENLLLSFELRKNNIPKIFVSASAIGVYGDRQGEELQEQSTAGEGFLADVCKKWEEPFRVIQKDNKWKSTRMVQMRIGVVLSETGGALEKMLPLFKKNLGGVLSDGAQWMSWIHIEDAVRAIQECLQNEKLSGPVNLVAPQPVTNRDFSRLLAQGLEKGLGPSVPALALKTTLGEMATMILASQRVMPTKLHECGFHFKFQDLASAFSDLLKNHQDGDNLFVAEQFIPLARQRLFPFFAEAKNLERITPSTLSFQIEKMSTPHITEGTLIDYRLKIRGVPVRWRTLIQDWKPDHQFVDTQLKGPYSKWHHTHLFEDLAGGTLMTDVVRYRLPLGILGQVVAGGFVLNDVNKIFDFRREFVAKQWPQNGT